jgi:hypothetical protein
MAVPEIKIVVILLGKGHQLFFIMRIIFTEEDSITHTQARYLRGGLLRNYHRVLVLRTFDRIPQADLWFHGLYNNPETRFPEPVRSGMERFSGCIVFFQNDDALTLSTKVPPRSLNGRACFSETYGLRTPA